MDTSPDMALRIWSRASRSLRSRSPGSEDGGAASSRRSSPRFVFALEPSSVHESDGTAMGIVAVALNSVGPEQQPGARPMSQKQKGFFNSMNDKELPERHCHGALSTQSAQGVTQITGARQYRSRLLTKRFDGGSKV